MQTGDSIISFILILSLFAAAAAALQVNNRLVSAILVSCRYLQTLILEGCVRISDSAFVAEGGQPQLGTTIGIMLLLFMMMLSNTLGLARLQQLSVGGCGQLSAFALQRVTDVAKKTLVKLDVSQTGAKSPCFDKLVGVSSE